MGLQHDHVSRASLQQLKPELAVSMTAEKYECSSTEAKCSVRGALCPSSNFLLACDRNLFLPSMYFLLGSTPLANCWGVMCVLVLQLQQVDSVHTFWMETLSWTSYVSIAMNQRERGIQQSDCYHAYFLQASMAYTCDTSCKPLLGQKPTLRSWSCSAVGLETMPMWWCLNCRVSLQRTIVLSLGSRLSLGPRTSHLQDWLSVLQ